MRTEQEMFTLILDFARQHEDIRAVVMTGSRANPLTVPDRFQDYDITYLVDDVSPYRGDLAVPAYFGEIMILQTPDDMGECPSAAASYAFLMQFADGNRIDLTFRGLDDIGAVSEDSLSLVLLDKDRRFSLPPPSLASYLPKKPTLKQFADCCNEFWWLNPYVAKGLHREQITYAKAILDGFMREQLNVMLAWYVGLTTEFQVSVGFLGKHLKHHLPPDLWRLLELSYSDAHLEHIWRSLFVMDDLFREAVRPVAKAFQFEYPEREDAAVSSFVRQIHRELSEKSGLNVSSSRTD